MKEELAFTLVRQLKKAGHDVSMTDAPSSGVGGTAIVGNKNRDAKSVEACVSMCRKEMLDNSSAYVIETSANKNRRFPAFSFAAW